MERTDRLRFKDMMIANKCRATNAEQAIEHEISLSNNATLSQSELIRMFFISYDKSERCFCSLREKDRCILLHFSMLQF